MNRPYSPSVRRGNLVFTAGQCGYHLDKTLAEGFQAQTRLALENLGGALALSGATFADVVSVNVFLASGDDFEAMNAVYTEFFAEPFPARTTVTVGLRPGVLFEVNAQAVVSDQ
ncbi:RidA family protein [Antrihabitans sp. YC2-6]|uniref:RidA family protein n=1 Tax=Antrihabitans sp. YC2-6 TaxID=2799498 RepID=UPI0018F3ECE3|nr:RidA family protein [Antrihabitans sp. YC2-6]MBJ8344321.1 RidA family protein [Antrihabitans sp. YC2-6]